MALALVVLFATAAERAYMRRATAQHIHAVVSVARDLFVAMQTIRVERGTINTGLETTATIDPDTRGDLAALRKRSNAAFESALAKIKDMGIPESDAGLSKMLAARGEFDRMRVSVDAAMLLPKSERPPTLSGLWVAGGGMLTASIDALSEQLSGEIKRDVAGEFTAALRRRFPVEIKQADLDRLF